MDAILSCLLRIESVGLEGVDEKMWLDWLFLEPLNQAGLGLSSESNLLDSDGNGVGLD